MKKKLWNNKSVGAFILVMVGIVMGGMMLIKFNTPAAAQFADNVLRPLIGDKTVVEMEKIYFNAADSWTKWTYKAKPGQTPSVAITGSSWTEEEMKLDPIAIKYGFLPGVNEGEWIKKNDWTAITYVRPDPDRPYAYVTVAALDMKKLRLGIVAGTKQPGGPVGNPGSGVVPEEILKSGKLVAAFDGGFQYRDGKYGMIVGNKTYLPLEKDLGTLVGYQDGSLKIISYQGEYLGNKVEFVRQNCPILIENGKVFAENEYNKKLWGRTFSSSIFTWRSGVGLDADGNLLYAVGNNITPDTLAVALQMAGAKNAIQLDINPFWVRFNWFEAQHGGGYESKTLLKNLADGSKAYLHGYEKDFFYVYKKD